MTRLRVLCDGLTFPEGPRWRNGRLYFSDFYACAVYAVDRAGAVEKIVDVPAQPSGLGWLPGGDMLVVSMRDQKVLRWNGRALSLHADLAPFARDCCNDMLVTSAGRAYVGNFGFDPWSQDAQPTCLIRIESDGTASIVAHDLEFPNGMALIDEGRSLVVAESVGERLTAFDVGADGALSRRRVFASTPGCQPDGICATDDDDVLIATMTCNKLVRVSRSGAWKETIDVGAPVWACAVGGSGAKEIFLCTSDDFSKDACLRARSGKIQLIEQS